MTGDEPNQTVTAPDPNVPRPAVGDHEVARRGRLWPQFDPAAVSHLMSRLGEPWDEADFERAQLAYQKLRRKTAFTTAAPVLVVALIAAGNLAITVAMTVDLLLTLETASGQNFAVIVVLVLFTVAMLVAAQAFLRLPSDTAPGTFFLRVGQLSRVLAKAPPPERDLALMLRHLGGISRALFATLQRSRFTWTTPPEVADRALRLTFPVLNLDTTGGFGERGPDQAAQFRRIGDFLMDTAALVAMGRPQLIPACRSLHPDLPGREEHDLDDRVALYLDPMRHRTRWEVIKDFVLPLAAWLGVAVSLWISLTR